MENASYKQFNKLKVFFCSILFHIKSHLSVTTCRLLNARRTLHSLQPGRTPGLPIWFFLNQTPRIWFFLKAFGFFFFDLVLLVLFWFFLEVFGLKFWVWFFSVYLVFFDKSAEILRALEKNVSKFSRLRHDILHVLTILSWRHGKQRDFCAMLFILYYVFD